MANYTGIRKEETLKSLVHEDYFPKFGYEPNIDNKTLLSPIKKPVMIYSATAPAVPVTTSGRKQKREPTTYLICSLN
jgi:hypothetical protein